jgi:hypothetical protein
VKVLALMRPPKGVDVRPRVAAHAREELRALWDLYSEGHVREMYWPGRPGAVLVLEAESTDAARSLLSRLPLVSERVMELELIELQPFGALERLFDTPSATTATVDE